MEAAIAAHPAVAEVAVVGAADALKGQVPLAFIILKRGVQVAPDQVAREALQRVREDVGPVASFRDALVVQRLPKTRSGKTLRATLRSIADGVPYRMPATIDDPAVLEEVATALREWRAARG